MKEDVVLSKPILPPSDSKILLTLNKFIIRNNKITAYRIIAGRARIVDLKEGTFNTLNPVATLIWELADGKATVGEIIEKVYREFEVNWGKLEKDCLRFINNMEKKGLMTLLLCPGGKN